MRDCRAFQEMVGCPNSWQSPTAASYMALTCRIDAIISPFGTWRRDRPYETLPLFCKPYETLITVKAKSLSG